MKKIFCNLFCLVTVLLFSACTHEEEDLFSSSSTNRADAAIESDLSILTSAEKGWLMEYYPEQNQSYGGYNLLIKFGEDGKVDVASEFYNATDVANSFYTIKQSAGIVLSFDTYNEIFHLFSDPSDPVGVGGKGFGFEGDYDFLILEATPEKVVLKGKKSSGLAVLTPMQDDWNEYITNIQEAASVMDFLKYELEINDQTIPVKVSNRTLTFTYGEEDNMISQTASFILTQTGYKFYEPVTVNGVTLNAFTFDKAKEVFTEINNENIKLIPVIPPLNEQFVNGNWFIAYSKLGEYGQIYFDYCKKNFLDTIGEEMVWSFMGSALYGEFGFNFNSSGYTGLLGYDYKLIGDKKISLQFNMSGAGDGVYYHNEVGFYYLLNPFGYDSARIFTLSTDNEKDPSYITLTEDKNPANSITLSANQINYPFKN